MLKLMADVAAFHRAGDVPIKEQAGFPNGKRVQLRVELIEEETLQRPPAEPSGEPHG